MSILNGAVSNTAIFSQDSPFGKKLSETTLLPLPGQTDVCLSDDGSILYAAGDREIAAYDITGETEKLLCKTAFPAQTRQVSQSDGFLYVTTRHGGVFIFDLRDGIRCIRHLDSLELATGISVSGGILCVANRHVGVEVWDVRDPYSPKFLSSFLCGEAQSVFLFGKYAAVGDWMNKKVQIFNLSDPALPKKASEFGVDGYADGVYVRDGLCFCSTGHHSARYRNRAKYSRYPYLTAEMLTEGYGGGHGLDIFDVRDPEKPEYLSSVRFPPLFVGGYDTWRVIFDGKRAYCSDTYNGFFVVNAENPVKPFIEGYFKGGDARVTSAIPVSVQRPSEPVVGCAAKDGRLYLAGTMGGIHVVPYPEAKECDSRGHSDISSFEAAEPGAFFACRGQVHSCDVLGKALICACGEDGLYALEKTDGKVLFHTDGFFLDAKVFGEYVLCAEGFDGIGVYRINAAGFEKVLRLALSECGNIRQIAVTGYKSIIAAESDLSYVSFFEFTDGNLTYIKKLHTSGILYHRHIAPGALGKYIAALPLSCGEVWFDLDRLEIVKKGVKEACPFEEGIACAGESAVIIRNGKIAKVGTDYIEKAVLPDFHSIKGEKLSGQPALFRCGEKCIAVLLNRIYGTCTVLDVTKEPKLIKKLTFDGLPENAFCDTEDGTLYISLGHGGVEKITL